MEYYYSELPNGIRIIHKCTGSPVAHAGIIIGAGSRHEEAREQGIAHLIEHCLFKGTARRSFFRIITRLEDVGGEMNAYTGKEETFIYASFPDKYYARTLELLSDIIFHSVFPQKEIDKEIGVVLDEINSYKDSPYEMINDEFDEMIFRDHPLGRNILGKSSTLKKFRSADLKAFMRKHYRPEKIVICSVGNIDFKRFTALAGKYFSLTEDKVNNDGPSYGQEPLVFNPETYTPFNKIIRRKVYQAHCLIGNLAFPYTDENRLHLSLLNNMLGGPAMSSRLNMIIREKRGLAYNVESNYTPYADTGLLSIYVGTDFKSLEKSIDLIMKEMKRIGEEPLGAIKLHKLKEQFTGQLAISFESNLNHLLSLGKSCLVYRKVDTYEEIAQKVDAITAMQLIEVARAVLNYKEFSMLAYKT